MRDRASASPPTWNEHLGTPGPPPSPGPSRLRLSGQAPMWPGQHPRLAEEMLWTSASSSSVGCGWAQLLPEAQMPSPDDEWSSRACSAVRSRMRCRCLRSFHPIAIAFEVIKVSQNGSMTPVTSQISTATPIARAVLVSDARKVCHALQRSGICASSGVRVARTTERLRSATHISSKAMVIMVFSHGRM